MNKYDLWLFDCDGVILDSNDLKTEAFRQIGMGYGSREAEALVRYHVTYGGVSRYEKLDYFFRGIRGETQYGDKLRAALGEYAEVVSVGLRECAEIPGVREFLERLRRIEGVRTFVVSGSDEEELRDVFRDRGLSRYFDGILGAPAKKREIVSRLCAGEHDGGAVPRAVFCGDSRLDYEVAVECGIRFIMVYGYTEWEGWREAIPRTIVRVRDFSELVDRVEA